MFSDLVVAQVNRRNIFFLFTAFILEACRGIRFPIQTFWGLAVGGGTITGCVCRNELRQTIAFFKKEFVCSQHIPSFPLGVASSLLSLPLSIRCNIVVAFYASLRKKSV